MKRILGVLLLVGVMVTPTVASAGEQIGVYVAPKFVYGLTQMDSFKGHFSDVAIALSQQKGHSLPLSNDFKEFPCPPSRMPKWT